MRFYTMFLIKLLSLYGLYSITYNQIAFNVCQDCIVYPAENDDDANAGVEVDDAFYSNHMYDSKLCGAAQYYKQDCGWGCKKEVKKGASAEIYNKKQWGGFEKFCLFFWSFVGKS